jgi:ATP synthase protein I
VSGPPDEPPIGDRLADAAREETQRARLAADVPEPSLGARLGQIGVLGWMIVLPMLVALFAGRWLDRRLESGIFFSAAFLMVGTSLGFWSAWRWMHKRI